LHIQKYKGIMQGQRARSTTVNCRQSLTTSSIRDSIYCGQAMSVCHR